MTQNNEKRIIAITGGIGSGKSAVTKLLSSKGAVLSCDEINKEMLADPEYIEILKANFPEAFTDKQLDKRVMAFLIFADKNKRELLNSIAHPEIMKRLQKRIETTSSDVIFVEVPLLTGTEFEQLFKEIIVVYAAENTRIERIMKRDDVTKEEAMSKIRSQNSEPVFENATVYEIDNSGSKKDLKNACEQLIKKLFNK
ncbi:MAG: dephospho-CoA kinase [Clostridia bacterium]|nr:dephospho-CoA kinase [Clostridia bacterium]